MDNKKIGIVLLIISIFLLAIFIISIQRLNEKSNDNGCFSSEKCKPIQSQLTLANLGFGFFGFIFALSIYLLFFTKGDEAIVNRLEKDSEKKLSEEKFNLIIMGLDNFEKQVVKKVREQDGITQNTLKLRVDMSKSSFGIA